MADANNTQNGVAKKKNRTLVEMAHCMMLESGLPSFLWDEDIAAANYVRNRCVTNAISRGTPYELWTGKRPDISHFRQFGSKVYILNKDPIKGKFDARGVLGSFV